MSVRRRFRGQRALHVGLRTVHIGAAAVVLGGATFGANVSGPSVLLAGTGIAFAAAEVYRDGWDWFRYVASWAVLTKVFLLVLGALVPPLLLPALWSALVVGSVMSHAPGSLRHAALWGPPGPCAVPKVHASDSAACAHHGTVGDDLRRTA